MNSEEQNKVTSDEYADLLFTYYGSLSSLPQIPDSTITVINPFHVLLHVPINQVTNKIILQYGYSIMPALYSVISQTSLEASGITSIRNIPRLNLRGQGTLIGIIDTGIDYTNPIFRYEDNTTKILRIWDQTITNTAFPNSVPFGTEYDNTQINQALQSSTPFDVVPSKDENGHGTMVAGIAAGNEVPEKGFSGVAPEAQLVVVKLKPAKKYLKDFYGVATNAVCFQESDILFALEYLEKVSIQWNRPMAICIAIGSSQGSHDGTGNLSSIININADTLGFSYLIAAGNEGASKRHYYGEIDPNVGPNTMELLIGENENNFSMEIWGNSPDLIAITIQTPSGETIEKIMPTLDEQRKLTFIFLKTVLEIDYQMIEAQSGNQVILVRFRNPAPGLWKFDVYSRGDLNNSFHAWLPMQGLISDWTFFLNSNPYTTILSMGNAVSPITVTAYNTKDNSLYLNASRGYTRTGVVKPEIAAPGVNILGPTLDQGFADFTGTSPAAAHTTGVAAMILQWAIVQGNYPTMNTRNMKVFFTRGAQRNPDITYPNPEWGYGRLDVFDLFNNLRSTIET